MRAIVRWECAVRGVVLAGALALVVGLAETSAAGDRTGVEPGDVVAVTRHFAFHSDLSTNLQDALVQAGEARRDGEPEPFREDEAAECFAALPEVERAGWNHAVGFYAELVAPAGDVDPVKLVPRLLLAGATTEAGLDDDGERRMARVLTAIRQAAEPAYRACRWPHQDRMNRRWIEELVPRLAVHEETLGRRLEKVFQRPWEGLPLRVDVVDKANWAGGHTINLRPTGAHILISSSHPSFQGDAALEMVFHEGGHFLTGRGTPLRVALTEAAETLGGRFRGDLVHHVHFWLVGEMVRQALAAAGTSYTPFMEARGAYEGGSFRGAVEGSFGPYLAGTRSLPDAVDELVRALGGS